LTEKELSIKQEGKTLQPRLRTALTAAWDANGVSAGRMKTGGCIS
jgi:hypothetical protein